MKVRRCYRKFEVNRKREVDYCTISLWVNDRSDKTVVMVSLLLYFAENMQIIFL